MKHRDIVLLAGLLLAVVSSGCGNSGGLERSSVTTPTGSTTQTTTPTGSGVTSPPVSDCQLGATPKSWIAGSLSLCQGALVYLDYVYDDYGADSGTVTMPLSTGTLSPSAGDATYPTGSENTADLVRLQLQIVGKVVQVEAELNTLYTAGQTVLAIAVDTDNNPATGGGTWPGLGIASQGWDAVYQFSQGDPATHLIHGEFPLPASSSFRVWAVTAQADGTVMNVAFRGTDEVEAFGSQVADAAGIAAQGSFWEDKQAAALKAGDITAFSATLDTAAMIAGTSRAATVGPGLHQRVYTSAYTLPPGQGISTAGVAGRSGSTSGLCVQAFNYLGKYQPYGIYIPAAAGPHGLQLLMHGCSANHGSQLNEPGFQAAFGDSFNRIIISPLGRGPTGFYSDISERDVLDVYSDALANYAIDPEQIHVSGYSMGGYGTLRLGALYPDRWAGAENWVGFTGDNFNSPLPGNPLTGVYRPTSGTKTIDNPIDFVGNFRNVPIVSLYSSEDELISLQSQLALRQRFAEVDGVINDFYIHTPAEHLTYILLDSWDKEAAFSSGRMLVKNPAHITFRTDASLDYPAYAITHDSAYWISGIVSRAAGYADTDLMSSGCADSLPGFTTGNDAGTGPTPLTWIRQYRRAAASTPATPANRLTGTLSNVASLKIDLAGACLDSAPISYQITTDGPLTLRFSDGRVLSLGTGTSTGSL